MLVGINGIFQFSEIFGGTLKTTTTCTVSVSGSYSLIYAEMNHLDIFALLNQVYELGITGASLEVESAGFYTYSSSGSGSSQPLSSVFPQSPVPQAVSEASIPVTNRTSFWLTVDMDNISLFNSLIQIGVTDGNGADNGQNRLSLMVTFDQVNVSEAIKQANYTITLPTTQLFNLFTLSNVSINYSINQSSQLSVSGSLDVSLFGSNYSFCGDIYSDSGQKFVTADITARGDTTIPSLFGGSFTNIAFTAITFNLYYPYGKGMGAAEFMVRGNVDFAGLEFTGLLYMQGTTPVLGSVVFTQSASISALFTQCIPGASWPSTLVDLTLLPGCEVYYNSTSQPLTLTLSNDGTGPTLLPIPPGSSGSGGGTASQVPSSPTQVTFDSGFNLDAAFVLSLLSTINVAGTIVVNSNGVTASIDMSTPIDIYVLQITKQGDGTMGPVLTITTGGGSGSMGFAGAILFFYEPFGVNVTVEATKDGKGNLLVKTVLTPTQSYPPLLTASDSLSFSYSDDQGFKIDNWPTFSDVDDIIDFASELKKYVNSVGSSACGSLVDFVFDDTLTQKYIMTPTFSSSQDGGLILDLSITYQLSCCGEIFATISLSDALQIPIPDSVTLNSNSPDYLWTVIVNAMGAAAESFIEALVNNPEAIACFLALIAGQEGAEYAATMVCREMIDSIVETAVDAAIAAADAFLGTAAAVLTVVTVVGSVLGGGSDDGGDGGDDDGGDDGGGGGNPPDQPQTLTTYYANNMLTASWDASSGADNYTAVLNDPNSNPSVLEIQTVNAPATTCGFTAQPGSLPARCTVAVTASNSSGPSSAATVTVQYLGSPAGLSSQGDSSVMLPTAGVLLTWTAAANATQYIVALIGGKTASQTSATTSATLAFAASDPAGMYLVTVTAEGGSNTVPSPASAALTLTRLDAPTDVTATATATEITVNWSPVSGAGSYLVAWTEPNGETGSQTVPAETATPVRIGVIISVPPPVVSGDWIMTVQALPPKDAGAAIAGPPATVTFLPSTPTISAQDLPGYNLTSAQNGMVITTEWGGQPIIPVNLPDGFYCMIVNYSPYTYNSNVLATPLFVLTGTKYSNPAASFSLQLGQSCMLTAASVLSPTGGTTIRYFVAKGN